MEYFDFELGKLKVKTGGWEFYTGILILIVHTPSSNYDSRSDTGYSTNPPPKKNKGEL